MAEAVLLEKHGSIAVLVVDSPPVNAIGHAVRAGIVDQLAAAIADNDVGAIVLRCAGRTFMAGADIREFGKPMQKPFINDVSDALEASPKPIIAAIHGTAFGGGLELALSCDARIAVAAASVGLPEVKLGILPGCGGTQRLPRLIGAEVALPLILNGNPVPAQTAQAMGILDAIVGDDLPAEALRFAADWLEAGKGKRVVGALAVPDSTTLPDGYFDARRAELATQRRGEFAPQRIVDALEAAVNLRFREGLKEERRLITACMQGPQSAAMRHVFFAEREAARIPGLAKDTPVRVIRSAAVVGAGTMGRGIAICFADAGIPVTVLDMAQDALDAARAAIEKTYAGSVAKGRLSQDKAKARLALFNYATDYAALGEADLIIEAVFETMDIKKTVFSALDAAAKPGAILATNTSYLDVNTIAAVTTRPQDVLGLHFFSPANIMRLLEIVRADQTADDVLQTALALAKTIRKTGVVSGVGYGFIGNRMLRAYARQANLLLLDGVPPQRIDAALYAFGMPMGLFQMGDMAGLDIGYRSRQEMTLSAEDAMAYEISDRLVEAGRMGLKTGAGFYDYADGSRTPQPSAVTAGIIAETLAKHGRAVRSDISDADIVARCFYALANEGCDVLDEGIALRASDIDLVYLNGYGFPVWRGGPMYWAAHDVGLATLLSGIERFASETGSASWTPSPLLTRLVAEGKGFDD